MAKKLALELQLNCMKSMKITFDAFAPGVRATRQMLTQMKGAKAHASNKACKVTHELALDGRKPTVEMVFTNDHKYTLCTYGMPIREIYKTINWTILEQMAVNGLEPVKPEEE